MFVIIKSGPHTQEGERGVKIARDTASDIVLIQNGVYYALREKLDGYCGTVYAIDEELILREIKEDEIERGIKKMNWDQLIDRMVEEDKVIGAF